jgi:hypothetical protein
MGGKAGSGEAPVAGHAAGFDSGVSTRLELPAEVADAGTVLARAIGHDPSPRTMNRKIGRGERAILSRVARQTRRGARGGVGRHAAMSRMVDTREPSRDRPPHETNRSTRRDPDRPGMRRAIGAGEDAVPGCGGPSRPAAMRRKIDTREETIRGRLPPQTNRAAGDHAGQHRGNARADNRCSRITRPTRCAARDHHGNPTVDSRRGTGCGGSA